MKAILAEKPSVAREIAQIVGANKKKDGFIEGNDYMITWAFGHLIGLALPEEYGYESFQRESLPMLPTEFLLSPRQIKKGISYEFDKGALKQLKIIESVFNKCSSIIVATDAGREGELIFRYIYNYLGCKKPFSRLWISSLTNKSIREGLNNLKNGTDYDKLYRAAKIRSESDWLVGLNATKAITISAGRGLYSLGRVQTPTLAMVCKRYLENKHFVYKPYWTVEAELKKNGTSFRVFVEEKFEYKAKAESIYQSIESSKQAIITKVECKQRTEKPPLLYDLTTLQKEANNKLGFSADKTLSIAQKLYEAKLTTYPRTGSRYISQDIFEEIPSLIKVLQIHPDLGDYAKTLKELNKRCVNDEKITGHHAILITENVAGELANDQHLIYNMIARRLLEAFSPNCLKEVTDISFDSNGIELKTKESMIISKGWRAVANSKEKEKTILPIFSEGETLPVSQVAVLEKKTKPKDLLTEASLLSAMESAGKELENEAYRKSISDMGIGTPATRASIIETLFARSYMIRQNKSLVPTEKGLSVYKIVKDMKIANVEMTGIWEHDLGRIEKGSIDAGTFLSSIRQYTIQITEELLHSKIDVEDPKSATCPKCNKGTVFFYPKVAKCNHSECDFIVFRHVCGKVLTDAQIKQLLTKGKTRKIKGLKSKKGSMFDAFLILDSTFKTTFEFPQKKRFVKTKGNYRK